MIRPFTVAAWLGPIFISIAFGSGAAAARVDDACSFELSAPHAATLPGGAIGVVATLKPTACSGRAQPTKSTVCIASASDPTICSTKWAWMVAQAFTGSSEQKVKFTVTGTGCSTAGDPADSGADADTGVQKSTCQSLGPLEAVL